MTFNLILYQYTDVSVYLIELILRRIFTPGLSNHFLIIHKFWWFKKKASIYIFITGTLAIIYFCTLTDYVDAVFECDSVCAFGLNRNGRPQFPAVCPRLPALDLIRCQLSIRPTTDHIDPSVKARSSKGADADCKRCHLQVRSTGHPSDYFQYFTADAVISQWLTLFLWFSRVLNLEFKKTFLISLFFTRLLALLFTMQVEAQPSHISSG